MLMQPEVLAAFCEATQTFVNLPRINTTKQVKEIFETALAHVSRTVRLPNGKEVSPRLQWGDDIHVTTFQQNRQDVLALLTRIANHCEAQKNRKPSIKNKGAESQALRDELSETLQRLKIETTIDFNDKAGTLRLFPLVFGLEAVCYLTAAAMLEPHTSAYVRRCELVACNNLVLHPGGRRRSTLWCRPLHGQQGQRGGSGKRRTPRRFNKRRISK